MKPIQLRFETSFFVRWGLIAGLMLMMAMVPVLIMRTGGWLKLVLPLGTLLLLLLPWREWRMAVRLIDDKGVTRHDGKRFLWADLKKLQEVNFVSRYGQTGALNHLDIYFVSGHARILPLVLDRGYEAIRLIQQRHGQPTAPAAPAPPPPEPKPAVKPERCSLCGDLGEYHYAMQKHGREDEDTTLPPALANLKFVKELRPGSNRSPELLRCPECGSYFLYKVGYEYLATGSEDEQELCRMTEQQAEEILATR